MNSTAKKILLERKFTSIEYMTRYVELYQEMVLAFEAGMQKFERLYTQQPELDKHNFSDWQPRGLPNIQRGAANA